VADRLKLICTWPVEVSEGVAKFWFAPLFGHSMAWPPEAAASFTTANGANRLWLERLSSCTTSEVSVPPLLLDEELELLELDVVLEDELEELDSHIIDGTLAVFEYAELSVPLKARTR
jgi:hypothetical protein